MIDWAFRNRQTGRITVAQWPNVALGLFLAATVLRWLVHPAGGVGTAFNVFTLATLVWWAADEVLRGVNPWRRFLGGSLLVWELVRLVVR